MFIFILYTLSIVLYFIILRSIVASSLLNVDDYISIILMIIIGLIPVFNLFATIFVSCKYYIHLTDVKPEVLIKRILFIKDNKDDYRRD